ncbi:hypothetical protein [Halocatena halophila]|uniref:hypothetical protein n=1 Tax=Halocatena halophila TaxID=2814576 RepID=UPI002ED4B8BF
MTGFKSGTSNPLEDLNDQDDDNDQDSEPDENTAQESSSVDLDNLPYLAERQLRGAATNADRTKQLLLKVRPFVDRQEDDFINEVQKLVGGDVTKSDAREAAIIVAQENPELVAEKLREWGIEYLNE